MNSFISALKSFKRNSAMTLASVLLVTLTLIVVGFVITITANTTKMAENVVSSLNVYVYLDTTNTQEQVTEIQTQIEAIPGVTTVQYTTKEDELNDLVNQFGSQGELINEYFAGENNPLSDVLAVSIDDSVTTFAAVTDQIGTIPGVQSADYGSDNGIQNLIDFMNLVKYASLAISVILLFVSLFIITNTIRLAITARRKEIEIMRLVGATKMYIRMPFLIEGMLIGFIGAVISYGITVVSYSNIYYSDFIGVTRTAFVAPQTVTVMLLVLLPTFGIVIGLIGSYLALNKHLKA